MDAEDPSLRTRAAVGRAALLLAFWLMISGRDTASIPVGLAAVTAATWTSLRLLPAGRPRIRPLALMTLALRFLRQSAVSGVEVAWLALSPDLQLNPGFVSYPLRIPPGGGRSAFCAFSSLLPGTLPTGVDEHSDLSFIASTSTSPLRKLRRGRDLFMRALGHD